jgi:predicted glycosyltransferase
MRMSAQTGTILFYAEDIRGLGHVSRCLAVARRVLQLRENVTALMVTGSRVPDVFVLPPRCDFIKLPTRRPWASSGQSREEIEQARLRLKGADAELGQRYVRARSAILRDVVQEVAPDVVVVDNEPLGFADEFREGLVALKERNPSCRLVYHMRDILDDADYVRDRWRARGVYHALDTLYDDVVVSGSRSICIVEDAYELTTATRAKLRYVGYVVRDVTTKDAAAVRQRLGLQRESRVILVTVGGGHEGYPVLQASLAALTALQDEESDVEAVLVAGPLQPRERVAALERQAGPSQRILWYEDSFELMFAADAIVSMGGYNSTAEALAAARPLVLTPQPPQKRHMREQLLRAEALAARGVARCLPIESLTPEGLHDALRWALARDPAEYRRQVRDLGLRFDGAHQLGQYLSGFMKDD